MLLIIDAVINLILGLLLLTFNSFTVDLLGVPPTDQTFYPSVFGAVLIGVGIALLIERFKPNEKVLGLGLHGAIIINLCGGIVLAGWLLFGRLIIPFKGQIFLWLLVIFLIVISLLELLVVRRNNTYNIR
jgi:hypothetical protein